ncbi:MAG: hypothetical protein K2X98_02665 [Alphaproteobacteria bacterium]|nr:hypothetical protein [Alphaproteobacteria bacterium]
MLKNSQTMYFKTLEHRSVTFSLMHLIVSFNDFIYLLVEITSISESEKERINKDFRGLFNPHYYPELYQDDEVLGDISDILEDVDDFLSDSSIFDEISLLTLPRRSCKTPS